MTDYLRSDDDDDDDDDRAANREGSCARFPAPVRSSASNDVDLYPISVSTHFNKFCS